MGAKGDGVTDDTASIQAMLNTCASLNGCHIHFATGTYLISSTLTINTSNVTIAGDGWGNTIFAPKFAAGDVFAIGDSTHNPALFSMTDFQIQPVGAKSSGASIHVQNGNGAIFQNFKLEGGYRGFAIDDLGLQSGVHISNFIIENATSAAIEIGQGSPKPWQPNEIFITDGTVSQSGIGLSLIYVDGLYINSLSIYKSTYHGVYMAPTSTTVVSDVFANGIISDSTVSGDGWWLSGSGVVAGIYLTDCFASSNNGNGFSIQPGTTVNGLQIHGGTWQLNADSGIIVNSTAATNILIDGATETFNSTSTANTYSGIVIAKGVSGVTLTNNICGSANVFASVNTNEQAYGIVLLGSNSNINVANNNCVGNAGGAISNNN